MKWSLEAKAKAAPSFMQEQPAVPVAASRHVQPVGMAPFYATHHLGQVGYPYGFSVAPSAFSPPPSGNSIPTAPPSTAAQLGVAPGLGSAGLERPEALQALSEVAAAVPGPPQPALGALLHGLPDHPKIIKSLDTSYSQLFTPEDIADIIPRPWHASIVEVGKEFGDIDLTTKTKWEPKVDTLAAMLLPAAELEFAVKVVACLRLNTHGAVGAYQMNYGSNTHCHILPVINFLFYGKKVWKVWKPGTFKLDPFNYPPKKPAQKVTDTIEQNAGDVLWLPPGWVHQVTTVGGEVINERVMAAGFAIWCIPAPWRALTLMRKITKESVEQQKPERRKRKLEEKEEADLEAKLKELLAVPGNV